MRLGCLPYLNVKPLVYTLETGGLPKGWELVYAAPAKLAELLVRNEISAAPVSSCAVLAYGFEYVPGVCIASYGPVKSVLMLSKCDVHNLHTLALDSGSLSGAAMIRIILQEAYGVSPITVRVPSISVGVLNDYDAALIIGDPAMFAPRDGLVVLDVAEEWRKLTGLPAVFALWAGNQITTELADVLTSAKKTGLAKLQEIARVESAKLGLSYEQSIDYLSKSITYDLGKEEHDSLEVFRQKLMTHGLLADEVFVR